MRRPTFALLVACCLLAFGGCEKRIQEASAGVEVAAERTYDAAEVMDGEVFVYEIEPNKAGPDHDGPTVRGYPVVKKVAVADADRGRLRDALETAVYPKPPDAEHACIFMPRHAVGSAARTLVICFRCEDLHGADGRQWVRQELQPVLDELLAEGG